VKGCVLHMTICESKLNWDGTLEYYQGTSLLDKLDLTKKDAFAYAVEHMTNYIRNRPKGS
jgi:hypothetical protein